MCSRALKAHVLFQRDKDYVVKDDEVIIVDEFTGRLMPGRRWSDGLHQAVEAKEGVKIQRENQTLATITFQNYFRMYKKLAGMTGTADTEAAEFEKIYGLEVTQIPTNRPLQRTDFQDMVYRTEEEKFRNAAKEIKEIHATGQPILVGTVSVEKSEKLSKILSKMGVRHEVLNAKNHEREAFLVAQAGRKGVVTVSTNMAGRGTDILLGGNPEFMTKERLRKENKDPDVMQTAAVGSPERQEWDDVFSRFKAETQQEHDEVVALGGLHILGTERHDSRRIDNQLRGRSGRQGDPGSARFYLSLQDDLMRIFGGERMQNLMLRLGMEEDVPIESKMITKRIAAAQKAVEAQNFAARKHILEYDDVMNKQRQAVYGMRRGLLEGNDQKERVLEIIEGILGSFVDARLPEKAHPSNYDWTGLETDVLTQFGVKIRTEDLMNLDRRQAEAEILEQLNKKYQEKEDMLSAPLLRETERMIMLNVIDNQWKDHLLSMDHLKEGIGLRGYGQKDPLVEYKKESYVLFQDMMDRIEDETIRYLFFLQRSEGPADADVPHPELWNETTKTRTEASPKPWELPARAAPDRIARRAEFRDGLHAQDRAQEGKGNGRAAVRGRRKLDQEAARAGEEAGRPQRSLPVRQRKEVQEMLRKLGLRSLAAVLPARRGDPAGPDRRVSPRARPRPLARRRIPALYQEFGFVAGEQAQYTSPQKRFTRLRLAAPRFHRRSGAFRGPAAG